MNKFLYLVIALLLAGCGDDQRSQHKIVELENRVSELERKIEIVSGITNDISVMKVGSEEMRTNLTTVRDLAMEDLQRNREVMEMFATYYASLTNTPVPSPPKKVSKFLQPWEVQQVQTFATDTASPISGVPKTVYNRIAEEARMKWPGDYRMQVYTIKSQVEAYLQLHR